MVASIGRELQAALVFAVVGSLPVRIPSALRCMKGWYGDSGATCQFVANP